MSPGAKLHARRPAVPASNHRWESLSDRALLEVRLCDLGLKLEGSWLDAPIAQLLDQLGRRGCRVRPHFWLSDEWMTPDDCIGMGIPFFLVHPRLMRLERHHMFSVEGGTFRSAMRLLRHETGHVVCNAHRLHRLASWRQTFGSAAKPYPKIYCPDPTSRRFVQHLDGWYAQAHPDEDWAETFAVWLSPPARWRARYAGWAALEKLEYVERIMPELNARPLKLWSRKRPFALREFECTLGEYYEQKRARYRVGFPRIFDRSLRELFPARAGTGASAARFLRTNRAQILLRARACSLHARAFPDEIVDAMVARCRELELRSAGTQLSLTERCAELAARCAHFNLPALGRYAI